MTKEVVSDGILEADLNGNLEERQENQELHGVSEDPQVDEDQQSELEALLDMELDIHDHLLSQEHNNQTLHQDENNAFYDPMDAISLETLALLSPHETPVQWQSENLPSLHKGLLSELQSASPGPVLTSPSHQMGESFQPIPSPCNSSVADEYDLASPVALPSTPHANNDTTLYPWDDAQVPVSAQDEEKLLEFTNDRRSESDLAPDTTTTMQERRRSMPSTTVGRKSHKGSKRTQQITPERKRIVKHGGIYSLLLRNKQKSASQPVLVDDEKHAPEVPEKSPDRHHLTKTTPQTSPAYGKPQHGSIYRMLRRGSQH